MLIKISVASHFTVCLLQYPLPNYKYTSFEASNVMHTSRLVILYHTCNLVITRSLAVQEGLVDHEGQFSPANCTAFLVKGIIQPYQYRVCRNNSYLLSAIARGLRRAVSACRNSFQKARWNCTAFEGTYLLGRAIETTGTYIPIRTHTHTHCTCACV